MHMHILFGSSKATTLLVEHNGKISMIWLVYLKVRQSSTFKESLD